MDDSYDYDISGYADEYAPQDDIFVPDFSHSPLANGSKCILPAFCDREIYSDDPLSNCTAAGKKELFLFSFSLLAATILVSNFLLPILMLRFEHMRSKSNCIKTSLAITDLFVGLNLICFMIPNYSHSLHLSVDEIKNFTIESRNSALANISGSVYVFSVEASLVHLLFLAYDRFSAIHKPLQHRKKNVPWVVRAVVVAWLWAALFACIPAFLRDQFQYSYTPSIFLYQMSVMENQNETGAHGPAAFAIGIILPYVATVLLTAMTGISAWIQLKSFSMHANSSRHHNSRRGSPIRPEITALITTVIMIATFTLTKAPMGVVFMMYYAGVLNCENWSILYTIAFFVTTSNSFLNVVIYTFRDKSFRKSLRSLFGKKPPGVRTGTISTNTTRISRKNFTTVRNKGNGTHPALNNVTGGDQKRRLCEVLA